jgi:hypothetical protein
MTIREADSRIVDTLIDGLNAYDVGAIRALFSASAVIDDPSTGERFEGHLGIQEYVDRFFAGYQTVTKLLSLKSLDAGRVRVRVEFTGAFGQETGRLDLTFDPADLIARIDADLE